jgi:alkylated DNA nucleotide flippase Atl1
MPSADDFRRIEELAGYGLTMPQIAAVLGMADRTLRDHRVINPEIDAALQRGKAKAAARVGRALFQRAVEGDVPAIRWWEMTREGRTERSQNETKIEVTTDAETEARMAAIMARFAGVNPQGHMGNVDAGTAGAGDVDMGSVGEE